MELRSLLNLCQGQYADDWQRLPAGGPGEHLLVALRDVASSRESPALAALHHYHHAVYVPDARVAIAWGMVEEDWREGSRGRQAGTEKPDWASEVWTSAWPRFAHVLLDGAMVWQVVYASIDWGAGISGVLPWPSPRFARERQTGAEPELAGWDTTRWEVEFALLLQVLGGSDQFDFGRELNALSWRTHDIGPVDAERERL